MSILPVRHLTPLIFIAALSLSCACEQKQAQKSDDAPEDSQTKPAEAPPEAQGEAPTTPTDDAPKQDAQGEEEKEEEAFFEKDSEALPGQLIFLRKVSDDERQVVLTSANSQEETVLVTKKREEGVLHKALWNDDKSLIKLAFYDMSAQPNTLKWITIKPDGSEWTELKEGDLLADLGNEPSRADDIIVESGDVFITLPDNKERKKLFTHSALGIKHDPKLGPNVAEASWGPNKKHVTFERCGMLGCSVYIVNTEGKVVRKIARAEEPDWK